MSVENTSGADRIEAFKLAQRQQSAIEGHRQAEADERDRKEMAFRKARFDVCEYHRGELRSAVAEALAIGDHAKAAKPVKMWVGMIGRLFAAAREAGIPLNSVGRQKPETQEQGRLVALTIANMIGDGKEDEAVRELVDLLPLPLGGKIEYWLRSDLWRGVRLPEEIEQAAILEARLGAAAPEMAPDDDGDVSFECRDIGGRGGDLVEVNVALPELLPSRDIANLLKKSPDAVDAELRRYRESSAGTDCFREVEGARPREPRYLYRVAAVLPHLKAHFNLTDE